MIGHKLSSPLLSILIILLCFILSSSIHWVSTQSITVPLERRMTHGEQGEGMYKLLHHHHYHDDDMDRYDDTKSNTFMHEVEMQNFKCSAGENVSCDTHATHLSALGPLLIGTPSQKFDTVYDTGSADTWVFNKYAEMNVKPDFIKYFDNSSSATCSALERRFLIRYGKGAVKGHLAADVVGLADMRAPNTTFGIADQWSDDFNENVLPLDGITGLAYEKASRAGIKPIVDVMHDERKIDRREFGFHLSKGINEGGSYFVIGSDAEKAIPSTYPDKSIVWNDVWRPHTKGVPSHIFNVIVVEITQRRDDCGQVEDLIACENGNTNNLPTVSLQLNGIDFHMEPEDYMLGKIIGFQSIEEDKATFLFVAGDLFMRNFYTLFDMDNNRIGLVGDHSKGTTVRRDAVSGGGAGCGLSCMHPVGKKKEQVMRWQRQWKQLHSSIQHLQHPTSHTLIQSHISSANGIAHRYKYSSGAEESSNDNMDIHVNEKSSHRVLRHIRQLYAMLESWVLLLILLSISIVMCFLFWLCSKAMEKGESVTDMHPEHNEPYMATNAVDREAYESHKKWSKWMPSFLRTHGTGTQAMTSTLGIHSTGEYHVSTAGHTGPLCNEALTLPLPVNPRDTAKIHEAGRC